MQNTKFLYPIKSQKSRDVFHASDTVRQCNNLAVIRAMPSWYRRRSDSIKLAGNWVSWWQWLTPTLCSPTLSSELIMKISHAQFSQFWQHTVYIKLCHCVKSFNIGDSEIKSPNIAYYWKNRVIPSNEPIQFSTLPNALRK